MRPGPARTARTYILFYKPFGVLSQFTDVLERKTIRDFGTFPPDVYPVGRLDAESEGVLLLTNDNTLKHNLLDPARAHKRSYLVQVEGIPDAGALEKLRAGLLIEGKRTRQAEARLLPAEPDLAVREKPIRFRKNIPTTWIEITLTEGRNRQIRKMTAAVGHPTLRLVRISFGSLTIEGLKPGEYRVLHSSEIAGLRGALEVPREK